MSIETCLANLIVCRFLKIIQMSFEINQSKERNESYFFVAQFLFSATFFQCQVV